MAGSAGSKKTIEQLIEENKSRGTHKTVNVGVGTGNGLKRGSGKNGSIKAD